jgi:hypothetical protein
MAPVFERSKTAGGAFRTAECMMLSLHSPIRLYGTGTNLTFTSSKIKILKQTFLNRRHPFVFQELNNNIIDNTVGYASHHYALFFSRK